MGSKSVSENGLTMTATWGTGSAVNISIDWGGGNVGRMYWKIVGRRSRGDYTTYVGETNASTASFSMPSSVKEFVFQTCPGGNWANGVVFEVDINSSGGGEIIGNQQGLVIINFVVGNNTYMDVSFEYQESIYERAQFDTQVTSSETFYFNVYYDDEILPIVYFDITFYSDEGYVLGNCTYSYNSYNENIEVGEFSKSFDYSAASDYEVTISSSAKPIIIKTYIDNKSEFIEYHPYIDNGVTWEKYIPCIDNENIWIPV